MPPTRDATGTAHNPFVIAASMAPKLEPLCVLYRNTEYRTLTRKPVVLALLGCWTSCRPTFHPTVAFAPTTPTILPSPWACRRRGLPLLPSFCVLPPASVSFSCRLCLVRSHFPLRVWTSFCSWWELLHLSFQTCTAAAAASECSALLVFLAGTLHLSQCPATRIPVADFLMANLFFFAFSCACPSHAFYCSFTAFNRDVALKSANCTKMVPSELYLETFDIDLLTSTSWSSDLPNVLGTIVSPLCW